MTDLVTRAQLVTLARTLHVPVERIRHLEHLGGAGLHELQQRMAAVIFDEHAETFRRLSALVPIVPLSIAMPLVQRLVPAAVAGRAAGAVGVAHPKKAAQALTMVAVPYAADAAPYLDPRAVLQLAPVAPPEPIVAIANEILRRADYITAAAFVGAATPELIHAIEHGVTDDEGLLRAGSYVLDGTMLSAILRVMLDGDSHRIPGMIDTVIDGPADLRLAALSVLSRCDADVVAASGDIMLDRTDPDRLADLLRTFVREGAAAELLTFAGLLSPAALDIVAANPAVADQELLAEVVHAAAEHPRPSTWRGLLDLLERTDTDVQRRVVRLVADLDTAALADLSVAATEQHLWPSVLRVLTAADDPLQRAVGAALRPALRDQDRTMLERHVHDLQLDDTLRAVTEASARR